MKLYSRKMVALVCAGICVMACNDDNKKVVHSNKITDLDASAYDQWTYVNLKTGAMETHPDANEWIYSNGETRPAQKPEEVNIDWHIAVHRYEIKTNEGAVFDTKSTDMDAFSSLPEGNYQTDEIITNKDKEYPITTDLSKMAERNVGYAKAATINRVLCSWVTKKATGSMPPTLYTPTGHIFVLKCKDGSWAKLQFTTAGNTTNGKSGFLTFNYQFYDAQ